MRWNTSGRLTPAAWTLISTSPPLTTGIGRSHSFRTSAGPGWVISIARMARPLVKKGRLYDSRRLAAARARLLGQRRVRLPGGRQRLPFLDLLRRHALDHGRPL